MAQTNKSDWLTAIWQCVLTVAIFFMHVYGMFNKIICGIQCGRNSRRVWQCDRLTVRPSTSFEMPLRKTVMESTMESSKEKSVSGKCANLHFFISSRLCGADTYQPIYVRNYNDGCLRNGFNRVLSLSLCVFGTECMWPHLHRRRAAQNMARSW